MTQTPESPDQPGNTPTPDQDSAPLYDGRFATLDSQLDRIPEIAERISSRYWQTAIRDQYPFRIGLLVLAVLCIYVMFPFAAKLPVLLTALVMLICLVPLVIYNLRTITTRFGRIWSMIAADGLLFRFLRDSAILLGHPIELGEPNASISSSFEMPFPDTVRAIETYLGEIALPDPYPPDAPPGLFVPASTLKSPPGGETHRVYEAEYRGSISRALSVRVAAVHGGSEVVVGFPLRPSTAESKEKLKANLTGRLQDRLISAKLLADLRDAAGIPALPISVGEANELSGEAVPSRAI